MTPQSTFMIVATIAKDQEKSLQKLLATMNSKPGFADPCNELIPYAQFNQLHVARFVIIRSNTNDDIFDYGVTPNDWRPRLAFLGDIDGDPDLFFSELAIRAADGLNKIFSHCIDFDLRNSSLLDWLHSKNVQPKANYINWRGRTVTQIRQEQALYHALNQHLSKHVDLQNINDPRAIRNELKQHIQNDINDLRLRLSPPERTPTVWWLKNFTHLLTIPLLLIVFSPLLLLGLPCYFFFLRRQEKTDPEGLLKASPDHLLDLASQEDIDVTNHFNAFGQVKPGRFRKYSILFLLTLLNYATRHVYRCGFLTRIQTIHFARWVMFDNNKRIYFASNYDGSAESYMDDFINKVSWGLNLVFSNTVGYPRSRWLIKDGARNEGKYKKTLRRNQLPSESWYKAYPDLTAVDLARHSRIRKGLEVRNPSNKEITDWLTLLQVTDNE